MRVKGFVIEMDEDGDGGEFNHIFDTLDGQGTRYMCGGDNGCCFIFVAPDDGAGLVAVSRLTGRFLESAGEYESDDYPIDFSSIAGEE